MAEKQSKLGCLGFIGVLLLIGVVVQGLQAVGLVDEPDEQPTSTPTFDPDERAQRLAEAGEFVAGFEGASWYVPTGNAGIDEDGDVEVRTDWYPDAEAENAAAMLCQQWHLGLNRAPGGWRDDYVGVVVTGQGDSILAWLNPLTMRCRT